MDLHGMCVISLTPFSATGEVDGASLCTLTDFYLQAGVHGIVLLGIMGEANKLTEPERDVVVDTVVQRVGGQVPVVVGVSAAGTRIAQFYARRAEHLGANAVMLAPPTNVRNLDLVLHHYQAVGETTPLALVVQDEPASTGVNLPPGFFARVANEVPTARYAKLEEPPTPVKISAIETLVPHHYRMFGGLGGMYFYEELGRGAVGVMTGFAYPEVLVQVYEHFAAGNREEARETFYRYLPLIRFEAQLGVSGVAIRKQAYQSRGIIASSHVRSPAPTGDEHTRDELADMIQYFRL